MFYMENFLKITNGLADPTRYEIYQTIIKLNRPVTVLEIANQFHYIQMLQDIIYRN